MNWYLFTGYAVFWSLLFLYIVYIHRKQLQLRREIEHLAESVDE